MDSQEVTRTLTRVKDKTIYGCRNSGEVKLATIMPIDLDDLNYKEKNDENDVLSEMQIKDE